MITNADGCLSVGAATDTDLRLDFISANVLEMWVVRAQPTLLPPAADTGSGSATSFTDPVIATAFDALTPAHQVQVVNQFAAYRFTCGTLQPEAAAFVGSLAT